MAKTLQTVPNFQLTLKPAQFRAIGHMVVQWAFLEHQINKEIRWLLCRYEHRGESVNFYDRFVARVNRWEELTERTYKKHPKRFKAVRRIAGRAHTIKPERDDIVHGNLGSSGLFLKVRGGQLIDLSNEIGKPKHIEDLACRISDINVLLHEHQNALRQHFRRGRPKSRKPYSLP